MLGRGFHQGDDRVGAEPVVLLGYNLWRDRFGGSPDIIGRTIRVERRPAHGHRCDAGKVRVSHSRSVLGAAGAVEPDAKKRGEEPFYQVIARLKPDVSIEQAKVQATTIAAALEKEFPETQPWEKRRRRSLRTNRSRT